MPSSSRIRRIFIAWTLPLALWTAVPAIQWCALDSMQACMAGHVRPNAADTPAAHVQCPFAPAARAASAACGSAGGCPRAGSGRTAHRTFCAGDPNGGAGVIVAGHGLPRAPAAPAVLPDAPSVAPPTAASVAPRSRADRPPQAPRRRCPPARAPPPARFA